MKTQPLKFEDLHQLQEEIKEYFSDCDKSGKAYTLSGLACHLKTNRMTLLNYEMRGVKEEVDDPYSETIVWAKSKIERYAEEALYESGKTSGAKFALKNNNAWKEQVDHDVTSGGEKITGFDYIIPKE